MITPTVGRIVHFYQKDVFEPQAAIVTFVLNERQVNLCVFDRDGVPRAEQSVELVQPGDDLSKAEGGTYCVWPPRV